jgi:hypothetical protein
MSESDPSSAHGMVRVAFRPDATTVAELRAFHDAAATAGDVVIQILS